MKKDLKDLERKIELLTCILGNIEMAPEYIKIINDCFDKINKIVKKLYSDRAHYGFILQEIQKCIENAELFLK